MDGHSELETEARKQGKFVENLKQTAESKTLRYITEFSYPSPITPWEAEYLVTLARTREFGNHFSSMFTDMVGVARN